jgi:hypothetical protein
VTLDECRANIGAGVVYTPRHGRREDGVLTSVGCSYAFVRYAGDATSKATPPEHLELLVGAS